MWYDFPHALVRQAYGLCDHRCECTNPNCDHHAGEADRCTQMLRWGAWEVDEHSPDSWKPHPIDPDGPPYISNIRILCTNCSQQAVTRIARIA